MAEEKDEILREQLTAVQAFQAELAAVDLDSNKKLTKAEIAKNLVEKWSSAHPEDTDYARLGTLISEGKLEEQIHAVVPKFREELEDNAFQLDQVKDSAASNQNRVAELAAEIAEKKKAELTPESIKQTLDQSTLHTTDEQKQMVVNTLMPIVKLQLPSEDSPENESSALNLTAAQMQDIQAAREAVSNYRVDAGNLNAADVAAAITAKKGASR